MTGAATPRRRKAAQAPILIWDGDCRFCKRCVQLWRRWTRGRVHDCPYQEFEGWRHSVRDEQFAERVYFFDTDGSVASGAEAVFKTLQDTRARRLFAWYRRHPRFAKISEAAYGFVARHRSAFSKLLFPFPSQRRDGNAGSES